jgi:hypothetical protein
LKRVRVVHDLTSRIGQHFNTKDPVPTDLRSGVVYEAACSQCNHNYIGKTCRHLQTRINEHLSELRKFVFSPIQPSSATPVQIILSSTTTTTSNFHMTTRSKSRMLAQIPNQRTSTLIPIHSSQKSQSNTHSSLTASTRMKPSSPKGCPKKTKTIPLNLPQDDIDELLSQLTLVDSVKKPLVPKSAMTRHYLKTGHIITKHDFRIILSDAHRYRLIIKESLLIRQKCPKLNGTDRSLPLYVFPEGIPYRKVIIINNPPPGLSKNSNLPHLRPFLV